MLQQPPIYFCRGVWLSLPTDLVVSCRRWGDALGRLPILWYAGLMEMSHEINVTNLDAEHRRAFEDVIGTPLDQNQRLIIRVAEIASPPRAASEPSAQTLREWIEVYKGLTDEQIEAINRDINTRADLSRNLP